MSAIYTQILDEDSDVIILESLSTHVLPLVQILKISEEHGAVDSMPSNIQREKTHDNFYRTRWVSFRQKQIAA